MTEALALSAAQPAVPQNALFLTIFLLAAFLGLGIIRRVSPLLHTPLMSLTNAISAIAVVGAILVAGGQGYSAPIQFLGAVAVFASMTNIISGFLITQRMLKMFKERPKPQPAAPAAAPTATRPAQNGGR